ncbi:MAG: ABC transporter permease [Cardiobacteriaceae bacterium]|nr:ABC transporter permease [Cardiobacteriaceae bacterium]
MRDYLRNLYILSVKEWKSFCSDKIMMLLVVLIFSFSIITVSKSISTEIKNARVALVDEDKSYISRRITNAIQKPYFQTPIHYSSLKEAQFAMDRGEVLFILVLPQNLERYLLSNENITIQITADATVVSQAGVGINYLSQIIAKELKKINPKNEEESIFSVATVVKYNPNFNDTWYLSLMNLATFIFMLSMMLVGAAIMREKERGTMAHLLVLPVTADEIALSKIIANSVIINIAASCSLFFVIKGILQVEINGSIGLFILATTIFLFSACAFGVFLATLTGSLPQFALLMIPIFIVLRLISGAETPIDSMPDLMQRVTEFSPQTHFVRLTAMILFRDATVQIILPEILITFAMGVVFLLLALSRFRIMLDKSN